MDQQNPTKHLHIVMFPWFAFGHMTPFLHLANKLAERGCSTTFLLPSKALPKLQNLNLYPNLIEFHPLKIPSINGLPVGAETASDIPGYMTHFLAIAFDHTRDQVEKIIHDKKPNLVIYDMAHWVHEITKPLGIKTMYYTVVCAAGCALVVVPAVNISKNREITEAELAIPPAGYPSSDIMPRGHEIQTQLFHTMPFGEGVTFYERLTTGLRGSDAIAMRTCYEVEGKFCDYMSSQYNKPVFLTGHVLPQPDEGELLEDRWIQWLDRFELGSVIYCAFGSEAILDKKQFQELCLGFEMTGLPFLVAVKPPKGASTVEEALPDQFEERVRERGVIWGGWVQQMKILEHPSVGCFVSHCGFGSMWESLMSNCQIVLVPQWGDQIINTRLLTLDLKVAVEVVKDENDWFSKEDLCKAIKSVMDKDSEVGAIVKKNHMTWRQVFSRQDFTSNYINKFVQNMHELVKV